jgi:hypothetical protein
MVARMSISNEDIKVDWELGDTLAITMDGDGDGSDADGTDGDGSDGDGSDGDASDGDDGDADGGDGSDA